MFETSVTSFWLFLLDVLTPVCSRCSVAAVVNFLMTDGRGHPTAVNYGNHGPDRFICFIARERCLQGALFETKVEVLLKELENQ